VISSITIMNEKASFAQDGDFKRHRRMNAELMVNDLGDTCFAAGLTVGLCSG
jgi:hypothetical protein